MIDASRSTGGADFAAARRSDSGHDANAGKTAACSSRAHIDLGKPYRVRTVNPSPAAAAAHKPDKLGLVNATRQRMFARSSSAVAALKNRHARSNATSGNGSSASGFQGSVDEPIQHIRGSAMSS